MVPPPWNWTDPLQNNQIADRAFHFQEKGRSKIQLVETHTGFDKMKLYLSNVILPFKKSVQFQAWLTETE